MFPIGNRSYCPTAHELVALRTVLLTSDSVYEIAVYQDVASLSLSAENMKIPLKT